MGGGHSREPGLIGEDGRTPRLYAKEVGESKWPIMYSSTYNIGFLGMEKIHPFDSGKWGKVHQYLVGRSGRLVSVSSVFD